MAAEKSSLKRKPLSDCTNTVAAAAISRRKSSLKSAVAHSQGKSSSLAPTSSPKSNTSTDSNNPPITTTTCIPSSVERPNPSPLPQLWPGYDDLAKSTPPLIQGERENNQAGKDKGKIAVDDFTIDRSTPLTPSSVQLSLSAASGTSFHITPKFHATYTRRRASETKNYRDKKLVEPFSCPHGKRLKDTGDQLDDGGDGQSGLRTDPLVISKKQSHTKSKEEGSVHAIPKEEVKKLKAYYADIDAFELPVEEAHDSDLD